MNIDDRLKEVIQNSGLSLPAFAERVGISRNTLISYRDGQTSPSLEFLNIVCKEFAIQPKWLILGQGDPNDENIIKNEFRNFGTVVSLDLTANETLGKINVELTSAEIRQIIDYIFERLPEKTDYQKKCKDSIWGCLYKSKVDITFQPVLNKNVLKEWNEYKIENGLK